MVFWITNHVRQVHSTESRMKRSENRRNKVQYSLGRPVPASFADKRLAGCKKESKIQGVAPQIDHVLSEVNHTVLCCNQLSRGASYYTRRTGFNSQSGHDPACRSLCSLELDNLPPLHHFCRLLLIHAIQFLRETIAAVIAPNKPCLFSLQSRS